MGPVNLMKFCSLDDTRKLDKPFSNGTFTYATNGHIIIRVPRTRIENIIIEHSMLNKINKLNFEPKHEGKWFKMPEYNYPDKITCSQCRGTKYSIECPECELEGVVYFENSYNSYEVECKSCEGEKTLPGNDKKYPCPECDSTGLVYEGIPGAIINNTKLGINLLDKIKDLPDIELFFPAWGGMVNYRFNGGNGILMMIKTDDK